MVNFDLVAAQIYGLWASIEYHLQKIWVMHRVSTVLLPSNNITTNIDASERASTRTQAENAADECR